MLARSEERYQAAKMLLDSRQYDACVVAYYYSVLQRMMYALNEYERRPLPYEMQNPLDESFHEKILIEIKNRIANKKYEESFEDKFKDLLEYRKKADYHSESITPEECAKCRSFYESLKWILDRYFPVKK